MQKKEYRMYNSYQDFMYPCLFFLSLLPRPLLPITIPNSSEENDGAQAVAADENKCASPAFAGGHQFPSSTDRGAVTRPECECK